jgi:hypothetical protein
MDTSVARLGHGYIPVQGCWRCTHESSPVDEPQLYPCHEDDARGGTRCPQGKPGALPTVAGSLLRR